MHGQMLHGQMVLGHLSTVKDGSTNLKCPPRYFPWGGGVVWVGGEKLKLMLSQPSIAGTGLSWNWGLAWQNRSSHWGRLAEVKLNATMPPRGSGALTGLSLSMTHLSIVTGR